MNSDKGNYNYNDDNKRSRQGEKRFLQLNYLKTPEKWHNIPSKSFIRIRIP
jgi:hypothetical protein